MSLVERDVLMRQLNNALDMINDEVENVHKKVQQTENQHMKHILPVSGNTQNAVDQIKRYLEESLNSTDDLQVKKKIKLAIKQMDHSLNKKSSNSI